MAKKPDPNLPIRQQDFEALAQFRYQLRKFLRFSEDACRAKGVTALQYQLLLQTKGYPGSRQWATLTELAERLQAKHHGVIALVARCEAQGLVQRRDSATDLRQVEVHLTAKGQRLVAALAMQHRSELVTLPDFVAMPVLATIQQRT